MIKFDLKVFLSCVSLVGASNLICQPEIAASYRKRSEKLIYFIFEKLNPFHVPILDCADLQVNVVRTLDQLTAVEFSSKCSLEKQISWKGSLDIANEEVLDRNDFREGHSILIIEHLRKYNALLVQALHYSSFCQSSSP